MGTPCLVKASQYFDSVSLMNVARDLPGVEDDRYQALMEKKESFERTKFGDCLCQRPQL
jgi:hypothetical protein